MRLDAALMDELEQQGVTTKFLSEKVEDFCMTLLKQTSEDEATLELRKCLVGIEAQPSGHRAIERFIKTADMDAEEEIIRRIKQESGIDTTLEIMSPLVHSLFRGKVYASCY